MTKKEEEKGFDILIASRPMSKIARAKRKGEIKDLWKRLLMLKQISFRACVLGVGGDEIISSITNLMYAKQPYTIFRDAVHIHPR
jgi:pyruvate/2-oxoglutarate dehydrogenase complex dihydrolipoamide dehydrogenase (E3) component